MALFVFCFSVWCLGAALNIITLLVMTIESFVAIRWPLKHHAYMSKKIATLMIAAAWFFAVLKTIYYPTLIYSRVLKIAGILSNPKKETSKDFCRGWYFSQMDIGEYTDSFGFDPSVIGDLNLWLAIGLLGITIVSLLLIYGYRTAVVQKVANQMDHHQRYNVTYTSRERAIRARRLKAKGFITTVYLAGSWAMLWGPFLVFQILKVSKSLIIHHIANFDFTSSERIFLVVCCLTSITDVLIYAFFIKNKATTRCLIRSRRVISQLSGRITVNRTVYKSHTTTSEVSTSTSQV